MELLPFGLSTLTKGTLRKNTMTLEFFADATNGDDANDGQSWGTAKQTLQAVLNLLPYVVSSPATSPYYYVVVHLKGNFTLTQSVWFEHFIEGWGKLILTGTDDVAVIDDNSGSNYTASGASTSSLTIGSALWTTDQHRGAIVEILSGPAAGQRRTVQKNTTTGITPTFNWTVNPGIGCTFRFVTPETTVQGWDTSLDILAEGFGFLIIQKITFGPYLTLRFQGASWLTLTHCVFTTAQLTSNGPAMAHGNLAFDVASIKVTDPAAYDTLFRCGASWLTPTDIVSIQDTKPYVAGSVLPNVTFSLCEFSSFTRTGGAISSGIQYGSRIRTLTINNSRVSNATDATIKNSFASAALILDAGIKLVSSSLNLGALTLSNITGNAIECEDSRLRFLDVVGGSGNTNAGLYAWGRSYVTFGTGAVPTVTGTVGDVSVDNTTQKSTWAAIDGGTPVNDTTEMVVVKKV